AMIFGLNLILAITWCALLGTFTLQGLAIGFAVGFVSLWLVRPLLGPNRYFRKVIDAVRLAVFFLQELVLSSLQVVWDVVTPPHKSRPGIIRVPLDARSDFEIALLAELVSLTPGTLSLEVSQDRRFLYVHAMFIDDADRLRTEIKAGMERRILEVLR
ncbi:MAG: Na+/H+ antiporter subunit E, partial [Pseudomonadota bacterium]